LKKLGFVFSAAVVLSFSFLPPGEAKGSRELSISIEDPEQALISDCSGVKVRFERQHAITSEEILTIPASSVRTLSVKVAGHQGGVRVQQSKGPDYTVRLCKALSPLSRSVNASEIRISLKSNELSVVGPFDDETWVGYLIIDAPQNASMSLTSRNGPIGLAVNSGRFKAHAVNGPISVRSSSASIDASTINGPNLIRRE